GIGQVDVGHAGISSFRIVIADLGADGTECAGQRVVLVATASGDVVVVLEGNGTKAHGQNDLGQLGQGVVSCAETTAQARIRVVVIPYAEVIAEAANFAAIAGEQIIFIAQGIVPGRAPDTDISTADGIFQIAGYRGRTVAQIDTAPQVHAGY